MNNYKLELEHDPIDPPSNLTAYGTLDLRLADCMDVMREFADGYFDLAVVDPPYGIGINMNQGRRKGDHVKHARKKWDESCPSVDYWNELCRVSKNQIAWGANNFPWIPPHNGWVVWDKDITGDVPFSKAELAYCSPINTVQMVRIRAQSGAETYSDKIHPTQKPVKLLQRLITLFTDPGDVVIDPCAGSGSTIIAASRCGRSGYGFEIKKDFHKLSLEWIKREKQQMTLKL